MTIATTTDLGSALSAAIQGGYVAQLTGQTYTITQPIVIHVTSTNQGPLGIDGSGATLISQVTGGQSLIQIIVDPGVDLRYLTLSNFNIQGNGHEGDGIQIVCNTNYGWVYNWTISNVTVLGVGGYGLDMQGSVFEGLVSNSWMNDNGLGGAYFAHSANGGQVSALRWFGGGADNNGGAGITLDNGARDLSIDGASFSGNGGIGVSAAFGITSVTDSAFVNNHGSGIWFQNYGNFTNDTFSTSGLQTTGISGYLAGNATLIGSSSIYTGSGADPTTLANLQGNGGAFLSGDSGHIVTGSGVAVSGAGGGNLAHIVVNSSGIALPTLSPVTSATTAAMASTSGTSAVETALKAALVGGYVAHLIDANGYTITDPIVINITSSTQGGVDLGGAKIYSQITNGQPVIQINVAAGIDMSSLTLSNFSILGNGGEGDGIKIVVDGTNRSIDPLDISNVDIEHVGGIGLDVIGNIRGTVFDSWMHGNAQGGARFANSAGGGVASGLEWEGGGFRKNGVAGVILDNGAHDMTVQGAYFVDNYGPGIVATSGITLVQQSGFENNAGAGALVQGTSAFIDDSFSTYGPQPAGVAGYLSAGQVVAMTGDGAEYYGQGSDTTVIANLQGSGTLAIAGGGNVVLGPNMTVSGGVVGPSSADANHVALGHGADDLLYSSAGNDTIDGGAGTNTVAYSGPAAHYSASINPTSIVVHDRLGTDGTDTLINIQRLQFTDHTIDTTNFTATATLPHAQLVELVDIYIAYFNRAPDALGLNFWGGQLSHGASFASIAAGFATSPEATATYPATLSNSDFVTAVYTNVLGRSTDSAGFNFWVNTLQNGTVTRGNFLLNVVESVLGQSGTPDAQYIANKYAVGAHFALTQGLSDGNWARAVMHDVDATAASVANANHATDAYAAIAANPATSEFVVHLVGVAV